MKKLWILCLISLASCQMAAQNIVYSNLKELLVQDGDTLEALRIEKRTKSQILMTGGADYKLSVGANESMCRYLKKRCYAVRADSLLFVNCRKLRYKKFRFGGWYAPAMQVKGNIYFSVIPVGSVAASSSATTMDVMLGGSVGDAIAASGLISDRVYYEIDAQTGRVDFVGKDKLLFLLDDYPDWKEEYLNEGSESAEVIGRYLKLLSGVEKITFC